MKPYLATALLAAALTAGASGAGARPVAGKLIFACTTASGKRVSFTDTGASVAYAYGRPGEVAEKAFTVPKAAAGKQTVRCCVGKTSADEQISLRSGGLEYGGSYREWRSPTSREAMVIVYDPKAAKTVARTRCVSGIVHRISDAQVQEADLDWYGTD
jgi:hypothetical protein